MKTLFVISGIVATLLVVLCCLAGNVDAKDEKAKGPKVTDKVS